MFRSKFFYFFNDIFFFLKEKLVFVNNKLIINPFFILKIGDKIQIIFNKNFFYFFKFNIVIFFKNLLKLKIKIWNLNKNKLNFYKQTTKYISKKFDKTITLKQNIPLFLEIDFLTMTIILIFFPKKFNNLNFIFYNFFSIYMFKLYNWREL